MKRYSRRTGGWIKDILVLLGLLFFISALALGFSRLMEKGAPARQKMGQDAERLIADAVERSVRETGAVIDTPIVTEPIALLRGELIAALPALMNPTDQDSLDIRVLVLESDRVNALALPGNLIVLFSGLILSMEGQGELAGVLAHEIGHCVNHDSRNAFIRELGISVLLGATGAGAAAETAAELMGSAVQLKYGRWAERRADVFAVELLSAAGKNPHAYSRALLRLQDTDRETPTWVEYLDVHPPVEDRIADTSRLAETLSETNHGIRSESLIDEDRWTALLEALEQANL